MNIAHKIVDILLDEGWWDDLKTTLGFGQDSLGLGKNTEPGWTPSYGQKVKAKNAKAEEELRKKREELRLLKYMRGTRSGENTWEID